MKGYENSLCYFPSYLEAVISRTGQVKEMGKWAEIDDEVWEEGREEKREWGQLTDSTDLALLVSCTYRSC